MSNGNGRRKCAVIFLPYDGKAKRTPNPILVRGNFETVDVLVRECVARFPQGLSDRSLGFYRVAFGNEHDEHIRNQESSFAKQLLGVTREKLPEFLVGQASSLFAT